ncbi:MAG: redoxin domain-containing protein [Isosphaeraceae bacterium]|nr:redoxin domain-containing protein [Isosphaeraceae bacterium]
MSQFPRWSGVLWAACVCCAPAALADEPAKPTRTASEANPATPAAGHSVHGESFDEGPRQKAYLMPGMGKVQFAVTTAKPEAQAFVSQGVAQLHSFFYFESERSFRQAAQIDPDCVMAYWGAAMANVNNARRAKGFLAEAKKRAATAKITPRERLYLDSLDALYQDGVDEKARKEKHLLALETIVQDFPEDIDARAWLAMVTWQNTSPPVRASIGSRQAVDTLLDTVLQAEPMHPGAHHYRIHLWDGVKPRRAEKSAALFGKAAPGIAHAWHMPGHTYTGLQRYADAAYQQEASARVDHAYMIRDRVMPFEIHNYAHNNQWLCTTLSHVGRARDAIVVARNLVEQARDPNQNGPNDGGSPQRSGRLRWAEVLTRYELWDDLIAATTADALDWSTIPLERKERAYTLGLAYAAKGDQAKLAEQITALKGLPNAAKEFAAPIAELEGHQHLAKGDIGPAFEQFAKAGGMRTEALARAHLTARNFGFAESTAKDAVAKQPDQVPPLAALVEILHACGKTKAAQDAYRKLEPLARHADRDLPVFQRLAPIVAAWKADKTWQDPATPNEQGSDDATQNRIDLSTLGPLTWSPYPAKPFAQPDTADKPWSLAEHKGRNVVVIFFLGGKCAHCMQQLQAFGKEFEALKKLQTDVVAIGTDDLAATKTLKENADGVKFPMPILPDPKHELFKAYRAFDDFESQPMHGTFLIDAQGNVRYQRVSAEPFLDVEFIKTEAARVSRLVKP